MEHFNIYIINLIVALAFIIVINNFTINIIKLMKCLNILYLLEIIFVPVSFYESIKSHSFFHTIYDVPTGGEDICLASVLYKSRLQF